MCVYLKLLIVQTVHICAGKIFSHGIDFIFLVFFMNPVDSKTNEIHSFIQSTREMQSPHLLIFSPKPTTRAGPGHN